MKRVYRLKKRLVGLIGLVTILSVVTMSAFAEFTIESKTQNTQNPHLYTQFSYTLSESTPILAIIPENLTGGISLLNFGRLSSSLPSFNYKSEKTAHFSLFRERLLEQRYANTPGQHGKGVALVFTYSKSYFVYNLREIIV